MRTLPQKYSVGWEEKYNTFVENTLKEITDNKRKIAILQYKNKTPSDSKIYIYGNRTISGNIIDNNNEEEEEEEKKDDFFSVDPSQINGLFSDNKSNI